MPGGRPTSFTKELGELICTRLSQGESLRGICRDEDMPDCSSVCLWIIKGEAEDVRYQEFSQQYARAREVQTELQMEGYIELADNLTIPAEDRRIMLDARKWHAGKMRRKYGDKTVIAGDRENPIQANVSITADPEALVRETLFLAAKIKSEREALQITQEAIEQD